MWLLTVLVTFNKFSGPGTECYSTHPTTETHTVGYGSCISLSQEREGEEEEEKEEATEGFLLASLSPSRKLSQELFDKPHFSPHEKRGLNCPLPCSPQREGPPGTSPRNQAKAQAATSAPRRKGGWAKAASLGGTSNPALLHYGGESAPRPGLPHLEGLEPDTRPSAYKGDESRSAAPARAHRAERQPSPPRWS